jgi:hypothetical protein
MVALKVPAIVNSATQRCNANGFDMTTDEVGWSASQTEMPFRGKRRTQWRDDYMLPRVTREGRGEKRLVYFPWRFATDAVTTLQPRLRRMTTRAVKAGVAVGWEMGTDREGVPVCVFIDGESSAVPPASLVSPSANKEGADV